MSAETLHRAAEAIRNDWRDEDGREFMFAVADWLEYVADRGDLAAINHRARALAVANAYLQETP